MIVITRYDAPVPCLPQVVEEPRSRLAAELRHPTVAIGAIEGILIASLHFRVSREATAWSDVISRSTASRRSVVDRFAARSADPKVARQQTGSTTDRNRGCPVRREAGTIERRDVPSLGGLLRLPRRPDHARRGRSAHAQSGTRTTPDGKQVLISKDVGAERWAIAPNLNDGTVTGNVFRQEGEPQFVWCERSQHLGIRVKTEIQPSAAAPDRCASSPCLATSWTELGQVSPFGSFFLPAADPPAQAGPAISAIRSATARGPRRGGDYGIQSGFCDFVTAMQPSMTNIDAGEEMSIRIWHFALTAPDPGKRTAIQVGDQMLWRPVCRSPASPA